MGLENHTWVFLQEEGTTTVADLVEFIEDKIWSQVINNYKNPSRVEPEGGGALIPKEIFHISAKYQIRLKVAASVISYYEWKSRSLTARNIDWEPRLKNFPVQWKYIQDLKKNDDTTLTKISNMVLIVKWFEAYESYSPQVIFQANS